MPCLDKVVLLNRYWKSANKNSNDFNCKSLICRLLSLRCLFIHELIIVPLQREVRFLLPRTTVRGDMTSFTYISHKSSDTRRLYSSVMGMVWLILKQSSAQRIPSVGAAFSGLRMSILTFRGAISIGKKKAISIGAKGTFWFGIRGQNYVVFQMLHSWDIWAWVGSSWSPNAQDWQRFPHSCTSSSHSYRFSP